MTKCHDDRSVQNIISSLDICKYVPNFHRQAGGKKYGEGGWDKKLLHFQLLYCIFIIFKVIFRIFLPNFRL
jgi:hypothetical protein